MKLSMSLNIFADTGVAIEAAIERCARAGFEALDFNLTDYQNMADPPFLGPKGDAWVEHVRHTAESFGLSFTQMHAPIFRKFEDTPECARGEELSRESVRIAGLMGVPWVVWEPGVAPGEDGEDYRRELFELNHGFFDPLVELGEKHDVGICLENCFDSAAQGQGCPRWVGAEPDELCALVDSFESDRVGVCWDIGHAQIQGLDQGVALRTVGSRVKMLHVQDNDGVADQHLLPFMGKVDWRAVTDALRETGYGGDFTYEAHNSFRTLPDRLMDSMLEYSARIGRALISGDF